SNETKSHLQLDIEQHRSIDNRVVLIDDHDIYGRRKLKINWSVNQQDIDNIKMVAERILDLWPDSDKDIPRLIPRELDFHSKKPHDAYHPVGTCRMGLDKKAVVDFELKVKGLDNLWSVSTAVLPSAGTANPTFSILCLGNKLASQLK
ncbi:MAG: GMC family oxidoreductase, partial [Pseudomonadota bacterium]|nr:GMC family oxidoreductase [Pseudomonadota bacterium]